MTVIAIQCHQLLMLSALPDLTVLQEIDLIGLYHIGKSVRDQKYCPGFCHLMDHIHDQLFTFHINIGSGFIHNVHRGIRKKCPGDCKPLALSAGKISSLFQKFGIQTILRIQKSQEIYLLKYLTHLCICGIFFCHLKILTDCTFKQITVVTHQNHMFHQLILTDISKRYPSDMDLTGKFPVLSGKDPRNSTLTTAGLSNQGNKASRRNIKVNSLKDLTILLIGKMHILERNIQAAIRQSLLSGFRLREIQDPKDLVTGSHTVHGNMEKGAQEPERQEKFTGQKHNAESSGKAQVSMKKLRHCHSHTNSRTAISHNIHHTGRIQLHGQNLHGYLTEPLGFRIHLICFLLIRLIDLQSSQALKVSRKESPRPV